MATHFAKYLTVHGICYCTSRCILVPVQSIEQKKRRLFKNEKTVALRSMFDARQERGREQVERHACQLGEAATRMYKNARATLMSTDRNDLSLCLATGAKSQHQKEAHTCSSSREKCICLVCHIGWCFSSICLCLTDIDWLARVYLTSFLSPRSLPSLLLLST